MIFQIFCCICEKPHQGIHIETTQILDVLVTNIQNITHLLSYKWSLCLQLLDGEPSLQDSCWTPRQKTFTTNLSHVV